MIWCRYIIFSMFAAVLLLIIPKGTISADSFVSAGGYPVTRATCEDYRRTILSCLDCAPPAGDILYPVLGFPALITEEDPYLTFMMRSEDIPSFDSISLTRDTGSGRRSFMSVGSVDITRCGDDVYRIQCPVPAVLPEMRYDLTVRETDGTEHCSVNSVFFPRYKGDLRFFVWSDPQIEDLQSKRAGGMNFNDGTYPGKSDSILDFSRQEGIISSTISQMNADDAHFITAPGDLVFGIDYKREYRDIVSLLTASELPVFAVPGNHDGYALFTDQNDLTSGIAGDGLRYWENYIGPTEFAFSFGGHVFVMLNTYGGTAVRRASGVPVGIGANAAVPVSNWGGFIDSATREWVGTLLDGGNVFGVFGHMTPLGQNASGKFHRNKQFPKDSVIGVMNHQEWNYESAQYDSNPDDDIFHETPEWNTGTALVSLFASVVPSPIYFAGHSHKDRVYTFKAGEELVDGSGVFAGDDMTFTMTTTAATGGESYWGYRPVTVDENGAISYNYRCENNMNCFPDDSDAPGFQSVPAGNFWVNYKWFVPGGESVSSVSAGGDGQASSVSATVVNYLPDEMKVTLRFLLPARHGGYMLDNSDFIITEAFPSEEDTVMVLRVQGSVGAGSDGDAFRAREFSRTVEFVTVSPGDESCPEPVISVPDELVSGETYSAAVTDAAPYTNIVWSINGIVSASGQSVTAECRNDPGSTTEITVIGICSAGAYQRTGTTVPVVEDIPDPGDDADEQPDVDGAVDEQQSDCDSSSSFPDSDSTVDSHRAASSGGCSTVL